MKTKSHTFTQTLYIWATPNTYICEASPEPFRYNVSSYNLDAGKDIIPLGTQEVEIHVPGGIDLVEESIANLEALIKQEDTDHYIKTQKLRDEIRALTAIEYMPEEEV